MIPYSLRLPPSLMKALRREAQARGLDMASHIRSQLIATLDQPKNIIRHMTESAT